MPIDDRISGMTDKELENLHENAVRLSKSGAPKQQAEAARLLPIIDAAIEVRTTAAREASEAKKAAQRAARPKAKRKPAAEKAGETAE